MPISFPVMLPWSKQHFGKNNQGEWDGVHHAARRLTSDGQSLSKTPPVSSLCLSSSLCLIISSLGGTWGVGWAWFSLWNQAGNRCLGCLGSGVYDYCWDKHTFYMAFFFGILTQWWRVCMLGAVAQGHLAESLRGPVSFGGLLSDYCLTVLLACFAELIEPAHDESDKTV